MERFLKISISALLILTSVHSSYAQTLEPKLYSNTPIDLNILLIGYGFTGGAIPESSSLGLEDPKLNINSSFLVYGRTFGVLGHNAKFDIIAPYSTLSGTALHNGDPVSRDVTGLNDTKVRVTFNLLGAPALSLQEFASYQPDTIVGVSFQATLPTGQYDNSKLINIGTNRWAFKSGIGISKTISNLTLEVSADAEFYGSNSDFVGGVKIEQDAIYSTQLHALYNFGKGIWLGIGSTYYCGGEYFKDGLGQGSSLSNARLGATLALPINRQHAIKIYGNSGINTRYGTDFDALGISWQYTWAD